MAISVTGMVGYIRTRNTPKGVELYIDPKIKLKQTATGPKVTKPDDCAGILYSVPGPNDPTTGQPTHKLEVQYPEE